MHYKIVEILMSSIHESNQYFVAAVDVGTTHIRCQIYDRKTKVIGSAIKKLELLHPQQGWEEIDPNNLWEDFVTIVKEAITNASLTAEQIVCLGISTQRNTFTTWNKFTGKPYHNFITWKDRRAAKLTEEWNKSWAMKILRGAGKVLYSVSKQKRFLAASILIFSTEQVITRLKWVLENIKELEDGIQLQEALFGMIETWLLWKLTKRKMHFSDYSCVSSTAMFDPFLMEWSDMVLKMFGIPKYFLPEIKETSDNYGFCDPNIFGAAIPITCLVADQQAAMFGEGCFKVGDVKCTMGTGSFLDINTGHQPHTSLKGLYPLIGWKLNNEVVYLAEGKSNDTGTAIIWLQTIGLLDNPTQCNSIAQMVENSNGVHFVPAFTGLQAPLNDNSACAGFIGISPTTRREHLIRSVLESLAFRVKQMFDVMEYEADFTLSHLCVDGGVANCDFILQLLADLTQVPVYKSVHTEMSSLGCAFLAGLRKGVWRKKEDLLKFEKHVVTFTPSQRTVPEFKDWERAVKRCTKWYINK